MSVATIRSLILPKLCGLGMLCLAFLPNTLPAQLIQNGSFEVPLSGGDLDLGWDICAGDPDLQVLDGNGTGVLGIHTAPANGQRYLGMLASASGVSEAVGQPVNLEAGSLYYGDIDLFRSASHQNWDGMGQLEIWGGSDCNDLKELLWRSGSVNNVDTWQNYPIAFTPLENHSWMALVVRVEAGSGEMSYLCLDDIRLSNSFFAIDFLGFEVESQGAVAILNWETVPLQDDLRFDVEWSQDGSQFLRLGSLDSKEGDHSFSYSHPCQHSGLQYFRLSSVDRDGHEDLSEVRSVMITETAATLFPNPATTQVMVGAHDGGTPISQMKLLDLQGRECLHWDGNGALQMRLDLPPQLPRGCYFLLVTAGNKTATHRLTLL